MTISPFHVAYIHITFHRRCSQPVPGVFVCLFVFLSLAVFILLFQEIECLQDKFDNLTKTCQLAISNFTEEEGEVCALCRCTFQNLTVCRSVYVKIWFYQTS